MQGPVWVCRFQNLIFEVLEKTLFEAVLDIDENMRWFQSQWRTLKRAKPPRYHFKIAATFASRVGIK